MPRAYSVDLRERSLHAMTSGMSMTEVARLFGVSRYTLYRWRQQQQTTGSVEPGQSSGRPRRITLEQETALLARLQEQPDLTLAELCASAPVRVSPITMSRTLRRLGWARKKRV
jgi:transposase